MSRALASYRSTNFSRRLIPCPRATSTCIRNTAETEGHSAQKKSKQSHHRANHSTNNKGRHDTNCDIQHCTATLMMKQSIHERPFPRSRVSNSA